MTHSPCDQALVDSAVRIGCLAPIFSRDESPEEWQRWELRASKAVALSRIAGDLEAARADADAHAGRIKPERQVHPLFALLAALTHRVPA